MEERSWAEFQSSGLLWFINRSLHLFGWAIVFVCEEDGSVSRVFPARVPFRGFSEKIEEEGFVKLTNYLSAISEDLKKDVSS